MKKALILLLSLAIISVSCKHKNRFKVDTSDIKVDLRIIPFHKEFFAVQPDSIYKYIPKWQKEYGQFWEVYNYAILGLGSPESADYIKNLKNFRDYCTSLSIMQDVEKVFPEGDNFIEKKLTDAFAHYKYYFPDKTIPKIYTTITGFNVSVYTGNDFVGISLEKYLGKDYPLYKELMFDRYKRARMTKDMLPVDVMRAWAVAEFPYNDSVNNLLTNMIYQGRIQYFLKAMMPDAPDTLLWAYTPEQLKWAQAYEKNIWDYLIDKKLLFSSKNIDIKTFTGDAAFTTPFHKNSAPKAGTWVGYKIVEAFMDNNPDITLAQLMNITDYMQIYNLSYYEP